MSDSFTGSWGANLGVSYSCPLAHQPLARTPQLSQPVTAAHHLFPGWMESPSKSMFSCLQYVNLMMLWSISILSVAPKCLHGEIHVALCNMGTLPR